MAQALSSPSAVLEWYPTLVTFATHCNCVTSHPSSSLHCDLLEVKEQDLLTN